MKTNFIKLICGLALLGAAAPVSAELMTYTMTSHLTGSLGGTEFTNAAVTLTTTTDTTNIYTIYYSASPTYHLFEKTTIQIDGLNLATFDDSGILGSIPSSGLVASRLGATNSPVGLVGFSNISDLGVGLILGVTTWAPTYDLSTAATFTSEVDYTDVERLYFSINIETGGPVSSFSTDQGDLVITGTSGDTTFTAAAVPEPASAMMLMFGAAIGIAVHRARRSALRR